MAEYTCGSTHSALKDTFFTTSISLENALLCVDMYNLSGCPFGLIKEGVNLWWGEKYTNKIKNIGYVIGLRNMRVGISWRLDFDHIKGAHINQCTRTKDKKRWDNVVHKIEFPGSDQERFVIHFWKRFTEQNTNNIPASLLERLDKLRIPFSTRYL